SPVEAAYQSYSAVSGSYAQEHVYRALLAAPEGIGGFTIQAVAYDVLGQPGASPVLTLGTLPGTVAPKSNVLNPPHQELLTVAEPVRGVVGIEDIGEITRVTQHWIREYQSREGHWITLVEYPVQLFRDDTRAPGDPTPVSEPNNHYYIYWADLADGTLLNREAHKNERIRVITRIDTPEIGR